MPRHLVSQSGTFEREPPRGRNNVGPLCVCVFLFASSRTVLWRKKRWWRVLLGLCNDEAGVISTDMMASLGAVDEIRVKAMWPLPVDPIEKKSNFSVSRTDVIEPSELGPLSRYHEKHPIGLHSLQVLLERWSHGSRWSALLMTRSKEAPLVLWGRSSEYFDHKKRLYT